WKSALAVPDRRPKYVEGARVVNGARVRHHHHHGAGECRCFHFTGIRSKLPPTFSPGPDRGVKTMVIRLHACRVAAIAVALAALASAAFGAENNIIRIGALLPMSGPGSYFGAQDRQGIELALDAINKTSVSGYKFEIKFEDS